MPIDKDGNTRERAEAFASSAAAAAFDDIGIDLSLDDKEDLDDDDDDDLSVGRILKMAEEGLLLLDTSAGEAWPVDGANVEDDLHSAGEISDDDIDGNDGNDGADDDDGNANVDTTGTDGNDAGTSSAHRYVEYGNDGGEGGDSDAFHANAGMAMASTRPSMDGDSLSSISPSPSPDRRIGGDGPPPPPPPPPPDQVRVDVAVRSGVASARRVSSGEDLRVRQQRHVSPPTPTMGNGHSQPQSQPQPPSPRSRPTTPTTAQRRTNRYRTARIATNAGVGIRQGLRKTGRLFTRGGAGGGKRRRSTTGAAAADDGGDDGDDDDDELDEEGGGMPARGRKAARHSRTATGGRQGRTRGRSFNGSGGIGGHDSLVPSRTGRDAVLAQRRDGLGGTTSGVDDTTAAVRTIESTLRYILVVLGAYMLGVARPDLAPFVSKAVELGGAAWATCAVILALAFFRGRRDGMQSGAATSRSSSGRVEALPVAETHSPSLPIPSSTDTILRSDLSDNARPAEMTPLLNNNRYEEYAETSPSLTQRSAPIESSQRPTELASRTEMPHPELEALHLVDCASARRIVPNSQVVVLDNDLFHGKLLAMIRTSDADTDATSSPQETSFDPTQQAVSDYLRPKQRRFEFQFQIKFKKIPSGPLFLACEVDEPIKMGMVQRAFVGACLNFVRKMNSGFHSCLTGQDGVSPEDIKAGRYEKTHIAFTVDASMDALVATKPGDPLPELGKAIQEDSESLRYRKRGGKINWNTDDVYTMGLWSAYVDFGAWRCQNFPGIKPFSLTSVGGIQPVNLLLYILKNTTPGVEPKFHYECDKIRVSHIEISHGEKMPLGPCALNARESITHIESTPRPHTLATRATTAESFLSNESFGADAGPHADAEGDVEAGADNDEEIELPVEDDDYDDDDDVATLDELAGGVYLRSGDPINLQEAIPGATVSCVANGAGFAIIQNQPQASTIIIEKADSSAQGIDAGRRSKFIKNGDVVSLRLVVRGEGEVEELKYLSIHRGWYLKWMNRPPRHNGFFKIKPDDNPKSMDAQTVYIQLGQSFSLHHKRWSRFQVGASIDSSVKFGGRILCLYKNKGAISTAVGSEEALEGLLDEQPTNPLTDDPGSKGNKKNWVRPMHFRAEAFDALFADTDGNHNGQSTSTIRSPVSSYSLDAPAWIEMTHRTQRRKQRAYAVRVSTSMSGQGIAESKDGCTFRLRTGNDLAKVLQVGLKLRNDAEALFGEDFDDALADPSPRRHSMPERDELQLNLSSSIGEGTTGRTHSASSVGRVSDRSQADLRLTDPTMISEDSIPAIPASPASFHFENEATPDDMGESTIRRTSSLDGISDTFQYGQLQNAQSEDVDSDNGSEEDGERVNGDSENDEDDAEAEYEYVDDLGLPPLSAKDRKKKKKWAVKGSAAKVAKTMKSGTAITGKQVYKQSKKVGKGTVFAGRAAGRAITSVPAPTSLHKPPRREPRKITSRPRRETVKDHHVAVNKAVARNLSSSLSKQTTGPSTFTAGRLCAPDASCRTVSQVLGEISFLAKSGKNPEMTHLVATQAEASSDLDSWFLQGGAVELGIVPKMSDESLLAESVVARSLWDSHWREEWCALFASRIEFYAPFSKKPIFSLPLADVQGIRTVDPTDVLHPLPGVSLLAIETAWRVSYIGFLDDATRSSFSDHLKAALFSLSNEARLEDDAYRAHLWQNFSSQSIAASGRGKWAPIHVTSSKRKQQRIILNGRRMGFDCAPFNAETRVTTTENSVEVGGGLIEKEEEFVESLLLKACSFTVEMLENQPRDFIDFLDATSRLRSINLRDIDLSSDAAFCLVLNLYHCLLQHSLLLSIDGPPSKKTVGTFKRASCYEIGNDIFSLAELECCLLRGRTSKPSNARSPYVEAPKASQNAYRHYALGAADPRINFVLHQGDLSGGSTVPVFNPKVMEEQLNMATSAFLSRQVKISVNRRTIDLPKICDVYRHDFMSGDPYDCISFILQYMDEDSQDKIVELFTDETNAPSIKYRPSQQSFVTNLTLMM